LRFLIDECLPERLRDQLRAAGHDAVHVREFRTGSPDDALHDFAAAEDRIIVTADRGLPDHVGNHLPPAVFVISEDAILTFADQIPSLPKLAPGALVLFRKTGLRIAALVQRSTTFRSATEPSNDP
jgi:uncharacterized protein with PIN domain